MEEYKIVFTGNMGAGKTTAIGLLSDIPVVSTDVINHDETHGKLMTTVGIDYGCIKLSDTLKLMLYGTPGQKRFSFMWKIVAQGALGVVILIDATHENAFDDLKNYITFYLSEGIEDIVIGITHSDEKQAYSIEGFINIMQKHSPYALPIFVCDARQKSDVLFLLEILVASIEAKI